MTEEAVLSQQAESTEDAAAVSPVPESPHIATDENTNTLRHAPPSANNQRNLDRQMISGRARVWATRVVAQNAKIIDASIDGVSVLLDMAIKPGDHYSLHLSCFHHGTFLDAQVQAVCMHSTLSGRGFKTGFRFENLPENIKTDFTKLLRQTAK